MPYDVRSYDLAAAPLAVHPDSGFFQLSDRWRHRPWPRWPQEIRAAIRGNVRGLVADRARRGRMIGTFVILAAVQGRNSACPAREEAPARAGLTAA
jgi:hypothetical protein